METRTEGEAVGRADSGTAAGYERTDLIGTISIDDDPEVEALSCWSEDLTPVAELSRLGVAVEYQNRGIARILLQELWRN